MKLSTSKPIQAGLPISSSLAAMPISTLARMNVNVSYIYIDGSELACCQAASAEKSV